MRDKEKEGGRNKRGRDRMKEREGGGEGERGSPKKKPARRKSQRLHVAVEGVIWIMEGDRIAGKLPAVGQLYAPFLLRCEGEKSPRTFLWAPVSPPPFFLFFPSSPAFFHSHLLG